MKVLRATPALTRRSLLLGLLFTGLAPLPAMAATKPTPMTVWKDPNCGCCADWVRILESHGFAVTVVDSGNQAMRAQLGVPTKFGSCHTALVAGYVVEGHVPAADIIRMLKDKPDALGLTVPGMPIGSPGMDGPEYGGRKDAYKVLLMQRDGRAQVFASY
jgi:hypothetical protein